MRIISKFVDYYDFLNRYGIDEDIVFKRNRSQICMKDIIDPNILKKFNNINNLLKQIPKYIHPYKYESTQLDSSIIGFCGKLYPFLSCNAIPSDYIQYDHKYFKIYQQNTSKKMANYCFYTDPLREFLKLSDDEMEYIFGIDADRFRKRIEYKNNEKYKNKFGGLSLYLGEWHNFLKISEFSENYDDLFRYIDSPVFLMNLRLNYYITVNPKLSDYQFYKVFDGHQTHQKIRMYIGSILLHNEEPVPLNVSDKYMVFKKGFDKWSFRKMSDKNKKG